MESIEAIQEWVASFPDVIQWVAILLLGATPYIEAFLAIFSGALAGINPWMVIPSALLGNIVSILIFIAAGERINAWLMKKERFSKGRKKFIEKFNKYGIIGTSLLGPLLLPTQVLGILMITVAQSSPYRTVLWLTVSVALWSTLVLSVTLLIPGWMAMAG